MTCTDVRPLLAELTLGDLDVEPALAAEAHLRACEGCRAEQSALRLAASALQGAPRMSPSTQRREIAVAAMSQASAAASDDRRGGWRAWAAAAVLLVAILALVSLRGSDVPAFRVAVVTGRADILDRSSGLWRPAAAGERLSPGDRLLTHEGAGVRLEAGPGVLFIDQETSIDVVGRRRVALDRGRLCAVFEPAAAEAVVIQDVANNSVAIREGRVEVGLRDVKALVGGSREAREGSPRLPSPREEASRRLVARVASGVAELGGSQEQRLRASAGQEGTFDFGGQPAASALGAPATVGSWIREGK